MWTTKIKRQNYTVVAFRWEANSSPFRKVRIENVLARNFDLWIATLHVACAMDQGVPPPAGYMRQAPAWGGVF